MYVPKGLFCSNLVEGNPVCAPVQQEGAACEETIQCAEGTFCDMTADDYACTPVLADGSTCWDDEWCESGTCIYENDEAADGTCGVPASGLEAFCGG